MSNKVYDEQGRVAVLFSPDYGAGWYTWNTKYPDMLFDPTVVNFVLTITDKVERTEKIGVYATLKWPDAYLGGASDLRVEWLTPGSAFRIQEYDGSESVETIGNVDWIIA